MLTFASISCVGGIILGYKPMFGVLIFRVQIDINQTGIILRRLMICGIYTKTQLELLRFFVDIKISNIIGV